MRDCRLFEFNDTHVREIPNTDTFMSTEYGIHGIEEILILHNVN